MITRRSLYSVDGRGFTLIEILVVISIIALTTSLVLASLQTARKKAIASAVTSQVRQYLLAIELYRDTTGKYPSEVTFGTNGSCLGSGYPNGRCGWYDSDSAAVENPAFNAALAPYISLARFNFGKITWGSDPFWEWRGAYYFCLPISGVCNQASVTWWVPGNESCRIPGAYIFMGDNMTGCQYVLEGSVNPDIVNPQ